MTVGELTRRLAKYPPNARLNCLEVEDGNTILYRIVNVHLDLTGAHLIIEKVG